LRRLFTKERPEITLPTEEKWEYACAPAPLTAWHNGDDPNAPGD